MVAMVATVATVPTVAVVIVTYRSAQDLGPCLASLIGDPCIGSVVVVDSGSPDTGALRPVVGAHASSLPVSLVELGTNVGFGAACNRGAALTGEPVLVFLNPDTELGAGCVSALTAALSGYGSQAAAGPRFGVAGPTVRSSDGSVYPSARSFPSLLRSAAHGFLGVVAPRNRFSQGYLHPPSGPDWVSGTAMAVRRDAFEQVGGFDEGYFMYVEDVDLCWRLARAGWSVTMVNEATVVHRIGGSSRHRPYSMIVAHHRSLWRFAVRSSSGAARLALPAVALGLLSRALMLVCLQLAHARPPAALHHARPSGTDAAAMGTVTGKGK